MRAAMTPESHFSDIARTIQLAVAPVFLLSALGTILGVLTTRLGRIVDRSRVLADRLGVLPESAHGPIREEMELLAGRRRIVNLAITSGTVAALLVCLLIASAFVGFMLRADFSVVVAVLFVAAMAAFVVALLLFLREVLRAVAGGRSAAP